MEGQLLWKFTLTYSNLQITVIHCSQLQERQYITSKDKKVYYYFDLVGNVQHITIKRKEPITRKYFCDSYIFPVTYQHPVCQRLFLCPRSVSLRPTSKHPATHEQYCLWYPFFRLPLPTIWTPAAKGFHIPMLAENYTHSRVTVYLSLTYGQKK